MKQITIRLPEDLSAELHREARRRKSTVSEIAREAIRIHLGAGEQRKLSASSAGRSGRSDVSERVEELFYQDMRTDG